MRHVLVVANQTVGGARLIDAVRRRAATEPTRFTVIAPQSTAAEAWVVDAGETAAAARERLEATLASLRGAGIEASGAVVEADPHAAVMDVVESDPPAEIVISTLPGTRSGWLRRDLVKRIREDAGVPVEHVVQDVGREEARP